ncbi:MAG: TenA family protein [Methylobacteriaceae bacterium]|nr:TenA family protein [Methylobacteriaceae bacterium]
MMPAAFSQRAWARNLPLYEAIRDMPFNRELRDGGLAIERFRHYIVQDAHYLIGFGQALALAAAKADHPDHIVQFARGAETAIVVERELHAAYFRRFDIGPEHFAATAPSPTCHHYVSFLLATGFREPLPVHLAALLPCFWVYRKVGRHIHAHAGAENTYRAWIDAYAGAEFAAAVDAMIATTEARMHAAFTRATQLEWMFWDSAYRQETWPA